MLILFRFGGFFCLFFIFYFLRGKCQGKERQKLCAQLLKTHRDQWQLEVMHLELGRKFELRESDLEVTWVQGIANAGQG